MSLGEVKKTNRGFEIIKFNDYYKKPSSLQQSSLAHFEEPGTSAVWLGQGENRMHLSLRQVKALVMHLSRWIESGTFELTVADKEELRQFNLENK